MNQDLVTSICRLIALIIGIGIHEYAHCKFADLAGDPTPRYFGRVTLNLTRHFEPMGFMLMVITSFIGFPIGWGKPAPMDPSKMQNPRWDFFIAVAAGPISNFCQAALFGVLYRILFGQRDFASNDLIQIFLLNAVIVNVSLAIFNLIPFGPLDGHYLLGLLMPEPSRHKWFRFNQRVGFAGLFGVILLLSFTRFNPLPIPILWITSKFLGLPLA